MLHKNGNFGVTIWNITGGWVGKGRDFVNVKTGTDDKTNLKYILEVEKAWRSLFLDSPTFNEVSWALGMLVAHGVREGFFLPLSFLSYSPPSVSATEI